MSAPNFTNLRQAIEDLEIDAKLKPRHFSGIDGWRPYYAGFSRDFARAVLVDSGLTSGATVLDPWNGSGTTTFVADRLGYRAVGIDINPVANLIASAKLARPKDAEFATGFARRVSSEALASSAAASGICDPLSDWVPPKVARYYRVAMHKIISDLGSDASSNPLNPLIEALPPLASLLLLALIRSVKSHIQVTRSTNPTWIRPDRAKRLPVQRICDAWIANVASMAKDLRNEPSHYNKNSVIAQGDARALDLPSDSCDLILTSPPYCTRIDYAVSTSFELAALGLSLTDEEYGVTAHPLRRPDSCLGG